MKDEMIPLFKVFVSKDVDKPLLEVLHSGWIGQGPKVEEFEKALSDFFGTPYVVTTNSGTSALYLAYRLAGVSQGTDSITTSITCTASNLPILANGGNIIWADVNPHTGLIDPQDVKKKITKNTKSITCVDWGGTPCDLDELVQVAHKHGIKVIEDAAHAFGAEYKDRKVGTLADFTIFSFQAIKHFTTVDGGLLVCKNEEDYKKAKLLRWYGIDREAAPAGGDNRIEQDIVDGSMKYHMNDVTAVIGLAQLPHAMEIVEKHRSNAEYYNKNLSEYYIRARLTSYPQKSAYWLYTIVLPSIEARARFMQYMKDNGVAVSQVHARNDVHTVFKPFKTDLPNAEWFANRQVSIPVHWAVTKEQREKIVALCNEFAATNRYVVDPSQV